MHKNIDKQRQIIDQIDLAILDLLVQRFQSSLEIGRQKQLEGIAVFDPSREKAVLDDRARYAEKKGLNPDFVKALIQSIMDESKTLQQQLD